MCGEAGDWRCVPECHRMVGNLSDVWVDFCFPLDSVRTPNIGKALAMVSSTLVSGRILMASVFRKFKEGL